MTARTGVLIAAAAIALVVVAIVALGGDDDPGPTSTTVEAAAPTTTSPPATTVTTSAPAGTAALSAECEPIPGTQVRASGEVGGYPPEGEVDGMFVFGSAAAVWFSLDGPTNRNFVHLALLLVGEQTESWTSLGDYEAAELTYDDASGRLTGTILLRSDEGPTIDPEAYETAEVDLAYDPGAERVSGTVSHPDETFDLDLATEEGPMEYFEDASCYPESLDVPATPSAP